MSKLWLHGDLALVHVDRKASYVASDAKKYVEVLKVRMRRGGCPECGGRGRGARCLDFALADASATSLHVQKLREHLGKPELRGVLLLGAFQKICSKTDTKDRARPQLIDNNISVYRLIHAAS